MCKRNWWRSCCKKSRVAFRADLDNMVDGIVSEESDDESEVRTFTHSGI